MENAVISMSVKYKSWIGDFPVLNRLIGETFIIFKNIMEATPDDGSVNEVQLSLTKLQDEGCVFQVISFIIFIHLFNTSFLI